MSLGDKVFESSGKNPVKHNEKICFVSAFADVIALIKSCGGICTNRFLLLLSCNLFRDFLYTGGAFKTVPPAPAFSGSADFTQFSFENA